MLEFELPTEVSQGHKDVWLYSHDLSDRLINGFNCCLFDIDRVLSGEFNLTGGFIKDPSSIKTASNIICDIIIVATSQQYGGFSIKDMD